MIELSSFLINIYPSKEKYMCAYVYVCVLHRNYTYSLPWGFWIFMSKIKITHTYTKKENDSHIIYPKESNEDVKIREADVPKIFHRHEIQHYMQGIYTIRYSKWSKVKNSFWIMDHRQFTFISHHLDFQLQIGLLKSFAVFYIFDLCAHTCLHAFGT